MNSSSARTSVRRFWLCGMIAAAFSAGLPSIARCAEDDRPKVYVPPPLDGGGQPNPPAPAPAPAPVRTQSPKASPTPGYDSLTEAQLKALGTSSKELADLGDAVRKGDDLHAAARKDFLDKCKQIKQRHRNPNSRACQREIAQATREFTKTSRQITQEYRMPAQKKLVQVANKLGASPKLKGTQGTAPTDPGHSGWRGDTDMGGSAGRADKVAAIGKKMGLPVKQRPGYVEVGKMNVCVHKEGPMGQPGSSAHHTEVQIGAQAKETYVSSGMKKNAPGRQNVQVHDHMKKAIPGCQKNPAELLQSGNPANSEALQGMAKGTVKAIKAAKLNLTDVKRAMRANGIRGDAKAFLETLKALKGNASAAPEGAGVNAQNIGKIQGACRDILTRADAKTAIKAQAQIQSREGLLKSLESSTGKTPDQIAGDRARAVELRRQLVDSKTRLQAVREATTRRLAGENLDTAVPEPPAKPGKPGTQAEPPGRGKSTTVEAPPVEPGAPPSKVPFSEGRLWKGTTKVMGYVGIVFTFWNAKQGIEEAIAESDEKQEGNLARGARGGAYAVWYGLGGHHAVLSGREAGNAAMSQYEGEIRQNGVVKGSLKDWAYYTKAKFNSVFWGVTTFMGGENIYDAMDEFGGLLGDLYGWWKATRNLNRDRRAYLTARQRQKDWYCTNRPVIEAPVELPDIIRK